jgi:hypothetical protein
VPLREDAHRYRRNNGTQITDNLWSMAIKALRLHWIWSTIEGIDALAYDIKGLLRLRRWREPAEGKTSGVFLIGLGGKTLRR